MTPESLVENLELAQAHVQRGAKRLVRVRALIARMEPHSESTAIARNFLTQLEKSQRLQVAGRDRVRRTLMASPVTYVGGS